LLEFLFLKHFLCFKILKQNEKFKNKLLVYQYQYIHKNNFQQNKNQIIILVVFFTSDITKKLLICSTLFKPESFE